MTKILLYSQTGVGFLNMTGKNLPLGSEGARTGQACPCREVEGGDESRNTDPG